MVSGGVGKELGRLRARGGVHRLLTFGEQLERRTGERGIAQRGVDDHGRQPGRGQGLLHPVGGQGVDEGGGIADQQEPVLAVADRVVDGCVTARGGGVLTGVDHQAVQGRGLGQFPLIADLESLSLLIGHRRVDHHGDIAIGRVHRDRPGPAVAIGLDHGVARLPQRPPVARTPDGGERERRPGVVVHPEPSPRHDAGPARAVEHERRVDRFPLTIGPGPADLCLAVALRSRDLPDDGIRLDSRPGGPRRLAEGRIEPHPVHLPAGRSVGEQFGPGVAASPAHCVPGAGQAAGRIQRIPEVQKIEQLAATGGQRLAQGAGGRGTGDHEDVVPPAGQQASGGRPGRSTADDDHFGRLHHGCSL